MLSKLASDGHGTAQPRPDPHPDRPCRSATGAAGLHGHWAAWPLPSIKIDKGRKGKVELWQVTNESNDVSHVGLCTWITQLAHCQVRYNE